MHTPLELATKQIEFARQYTLALIEDVADEEWFTIPEGAVSHIGWQVGHLAMAEYGLTLLRIRDRQLEDKELIPNEFLRVFKKGSTPVAGSAGHPSVVEMRQTLDRVHKRALSEMATYSESLLNEPLPDPTAVYPNKLGSLLFCPAHEMLHAGQIGTLRRMLGKTPVR
jgi:hypothetical protein